MKTTIGILLFLHLSTLIFALSISESPFCNFCRCNTTTNEIYCEQIQFAKNPFSTRNFYLNVETNQTYPVRKLGIHHANISRVYPMPNSSVQILDLSHNRIQVIDKSAFKYLQNMTELNLSENELISELFSPDIFEGLYNDAEYLPLKSLTILRLATNVLHTLHSDTFEHITKIEVLDLSGNPFKVLDTQTTIAIGSLLYLKELNLSYTMLRKLPDHIFHTPKHLRVLNLAGNLFTTVPKQLEDSHALEWLSLNENPITNITEQNRIPDIKTLKILHLCYMSELTRIDDNSMYGLAGLKELHICDNIKLSHLSKNALNWVEKEAEAESWPTLQKLYLKNNKLTHIDSHFLARWDALEELDITDNPWTCECENNWLLTTLVKDMEKRNSSHLVGLICAAPIEMEGKSMYQIYKKNETLRCLDLYGARPERDATVLIGILIGLLVGIPIVLGLLYCHKRKWFGYLESGPAAFSRKFYRRTNADEEFSY